MKAPRSHYKMEKCHYHANGDALAAIYPRTFFHPPTPAGARKKLTLDKSTACRHILAGKLVASTVSFQENAPIPANYPAMQALARRVLIWGLHRFVSVVRNRYRGDVLIQIMIRDGAAERFAGILCFAESIPATNPAMKVFAALVR